MFQHSQFMEINDIEYHSYNIDTNIIYGYIKVNTLCLCLLLFSNMEYIVNKYSL